MEIWNYRRRRDALARKTIPLEKQPPRSTHRNSAVSIGKSLPVAEECRAGSVMGTATSKRRRKESGNNKVRYSPEKKSPSKIHVSNGRAFLSAEDQESQLAGIMISQPVDTLIPVYCDDELSYSDSEFSTEVWEGLEDSDHDEVQQAKSTREGPKTSEPQHIIQFLSSVAPASPPHIGKCLGGIISVEEGQLDNYELPKGKVLTSAARQISECSSELVSELTLPESLVSESTNNYGSQMSSVKTTSYVQEQSAYESVSLNASVYDDDSSTSSQDSGIVAESMALPVHNPRREKKTRSSPPAEAMGSCSSQGIIPSFAAKKRKGHQLEGSSMFSQWRGMDKQSSHQKTSGADVVLKPFSLLDLTEDLKEIAIAAGKSSEDLVNSIFHHFCENCQDRKP